MPDFAVSTGFTAQDRISTAFRKMGIASGIFENKATKSFRNVGRAGSRVGDIIKGVLGAQVIGRGVRLLTQGLRTATTEFISFDQAITSASAKFKGLNLATEEGQRTLQSLKDTAREVGATTQFTAGQAASGLDFLALAGFNAEQSIASLSKTVDLATVGEVDLGRATDIATDTLGAFNLMTDDTVRLQENLTRVNDVLARTMTRTNQTIDQTFEAIAKGAPSFTAAGQSMETFNALLGPMADAAVKGGEAGTALRNVMLRLANPVAEAQKVMDDLNIVTADSQGNFRDVIDILADFETGLKGMGTQQRTAALATVFGARTVTGINILLAEGSEQLRTFRTELENSAGASQDMANIIRTSLQNRLAALRSAAIEVGFKFIQAFEERGSGAIDALTEAVRNFDVERVIKFIEDAIALFIKWKPLIFGLIAGFVAYNAAIKIMIALNAIKSIFGLVKAIQAASAAQGVFNIVMAANPIGAIALAVAGLIALLVTLELKFKIFSKAKEAADRARGAEERGRQAAAESRTAEAQARREAPNAAAQAARLGNFSGRIDVNAPEGTTVTDTGSTGLARGINLRMLGRN